MKKFFKWVGIIIGGFVGLIIVIAIIASATGTSKSTPAATTGSTAPSSSATPSGGSSNKPTETPKAATQVPAPKATQTPMPSVGSTASKGNWEVALEKVDRNKSLPEAFGSKDAIPQGQFLVVLASVKNVGKETYPLNSNDFNVIASGDIKYRLTSQTTLKELAGYQTVWLSVQVQPQLSQKIRLVFDVPPGAQGLQLDVQGIRFAIPD